MTRPHVINMTERFQLRQKSPRPQPLADFHRRVEQLGLYDRVKESRRALMIEYFTSDVSLRELTKRRGKSAVKGTYELIQKGLHELWNSMPQEMQVEYKSPKDVLKLKNIQRGGTFIGPHTQAAK